MKRKIWKVWFEGDEIASWPCDFNPKTLETESNGGVEHLIHYKGKYYIVLTTWDDEIIHDEDITEVKPRTLEEDDYIKKLIDEFKKKSKKKVRRGGHKRNKRKN